MHLFVYGTLMQAGANHQVLVRIGARGLGAARTRAPRTLVDLGPYPALLAADPARDAQAGPVHGELYEIDPSAIPALDAFEGCPDLYRRESIEVVLREEPAREAFVYVLVRPPSRLRVLAGGRYTAPGTPLPDGASPSQLAPDHDD